VNKCTFTEHVPLYSFFLTNKLAPSDGHVNCDDENDVNTCHGFLLAVYVSDLSGNRAQFFRRYQRERAEPVTIISNQDLEGSEFLKHAHARLQDYHLFQNPGGNYTGFEASQVFQATNPPEFAVLSTWNTAVPWAGGAWHAWTETDNIDLALEPFVENNIFVVNEAFSLLHGWAEGSIKVADRILEKYFDVPRPWSFPVDDLVQIVRQTSSAECTAVGGDGTTGGGATGGDGGGGDTGATDDDPFCFTADALVIMADGTSKRIEHVSEGDYVMTGTGHGEGLVTHKLVHPVGDIVPVVIIETDAGDLIGSPSHPVLVDGKWVELGTLHNVDVTSQYVDAFYNLEVDGHVTHESTHSYTVHGFTASGLGDSEILNRLYPRQESWKIGAAKQALKVEAF
jgi:heme-degrading monooxygenase HmoA